jgi:hypothetical protein
MDHYANKEKQPVGVAETYSPPFHVPSSQLHSPAPTLPSPCVLSLNFEGEERGNRDETNWFGTDAFSQFSDQVHDSVFLESSEGARDLHSSDQPALGPEKFPETCMNFMPSSSTPQVTET